jgi:hypothetical protein
VSEGVRGRDRIRNPRLEKIENRELAIENEPQTPTGVQLRLPCKLGIHSTVHNNNNNNHNNNNNTNNTDLRANLRPITAVDECAAQAYAKKIEPTLGNIQLALGNIC